MKICVNQQAWKVPLQVHTIHRGMDLTNGSIKHYSNSCSTEKSDWDLYSDYILFSYRVFRQDSTKQSPFSLVYARQERLPIELNLRPENQEGDNGGKETMEETTKMHRLFLRKQTLEEDNILY